MEKVKITFLGTGSAVPTTKRNHSAILVSLANENILIDCGEGTQRQFRYAKLSPTKIDKILLTHHHGDHTFGLPGLLMTLSTSNYQKTLEIYGPKGIKNYLSNIINLTKGFPVPLKVKEGPVLIKEKDFEIKSLPMQHGTPSNAYSIILKDKIRLNKAKLKKLKLPNSPILKKLQEGKTIKYEGKTIKPKDVSYIEKGKKITIIMDTKKNPNMVKLAKGSDLLICESSFTEKESAKATKHKHMTAKQVGEVAKKAKVKQLILTHLSQRYDKNPEVVENEAKKVFKKTRLAEDLMEIEI